MPLPPLQALGNTGAVIQIMLKEVFEFAIWLTVCCWILITSLLEAVLGKRARILTWILKTFILPVMATFVSTSTMDKIRSVFKHPIQAGEHPGKLYSIPVFQRKDGTTLRIGHLVERTSPKISCHGDDTFDHEDMVRCQKVHVINDILITADMSNVTLSLNPVEGVNVIHSEEMLCDVAEVEGLPGKKVAATLAKKGMDTVIRDIPTYPHHIQRTIRKHMLAASLRREVQKFLAGFSMAKTLTLGTLDWRHDPGILGLERSTEFSLDYHVEKFTTAASHLDILMGRGWDVRTISGTDGYRVVLTLELWVDLNFDIKVQIHGCLCSGSLDATSYRSTCLKVYNSPESRAAVSRLVAVRSINNTRMTQDGSKGGISMAWDEFQPPSGETSPNSIRLPGIPSATTSLEDLIAGLGVPGTSTAMGGLDEALARVPLRNPDLMFDSPIKEESVNMSLADGPNTSTPADCLDNSKEEYEATGSPVNVVKVEESSVSQTDGRDTPLTLSPDQITVTEAELDTPRLNQGTGTSQAKESDQDIGTKAQERQIDTSLVTNHSENCYKLETSKTPETRVQTILKTQEDEVVPSIDNKELEGDQNSPIDDSQKAEIGVHNGNHGVTTFHSQNNEMATQSEELDVITSQAAETKAKTSETISKTAETQVNHSDKLELQSSQTSEANLEFEPIRTLEGLLSNAVPEQTLERAIKTEKLDKEENINKSENIDNSKSKEVTEEFIKNNPDVAFLYETNKEIATSSPSNAINILTLPGTPAKDSSSSRVEDYLKSLPSTLEIDKEMMVDTVAFETDLNRNGGSKNDSSLSMDDFNDSKVDYADEVNLSVMTPQKGQKEESNVSLSGSQASSRMTGLSSQISGRLGSGMFYGMVGQATQPVCPFPDDWQHGVIPESIENDDDLD